MKKIGNLHQLLPTQGSSAKVNLSNIDHLALGSVTTAVPKGGTVFMWMCVRCEKCSFCCHSVCLIAVRGSRLFCRFCCSSLNVWSRSSASCRSCCNHKRKNIYGYIGLFFKKIICCDFCFDHLPPWTQRKRQEIALHSLTTRAHCGTIVFRSTGQHDQHR